MLNTVHIDGGLTRDAEYSEVGSKNTPLTKLSIGFTIDNYKNPRGYIECIAWTDLAEQLKDLTKGTKIEVEGELTFDKWEDKDTGKGRSKLGLNIKSFKLL